MRELKLSSGAFAKIDDEDYEKIVNVGAWHENNMGYAYHSTSKGGKRKKIYMHRFLMRAELGYDVDHINHDPLDNRKINLRVCSHQENMKNRMDKAKGYYFAKRENKWIVYVNKKYGGRYSSEKEAKEAAKNLRDTGRYEEKLRKRPMLPKGVRLMKNCTKNPFGAVAKESGKSVYIGFFQTPEEASKAYQKYWEKRNGIF